MRPSHEASMHDHGHPDHRFAPFLLPLVLTCSYTCPELPSMSLFTALHSFIAFSSKGSCSSFVSSLLSTHQPCFPCCHASFPHLRFQKACDMSSPAFPTCCNPQLYPLVPSISRFTFAHFRFFFLGSVVNMFLIVPHPPL